MDWTRRDFIKVSVSGALGVAGIVYLPKPAAALGMEAVSRFTGRPLAAIPTTCTLCDARCGIVAFLHNGGLKTVYGNPGDPNSRGRICVRGLAGVNLQEDEERILQPLARTGKRGEGKWRKTTWDEAFVHLARILSTRPTERKGEILFQAGQTEILTRRFIQALAAQREVTLLREGSSPSSEEAHRLTWGAGRGVPDLLRARTILNFGSNPYSHHELYVPFLQRLIEAKVERGARLISFDVRLSQTAGLSDEWIPLAPGTDGLVALAMARVILENGLHDRPFLERWTNCSVDGLRQHLTPFTLERAQAESGMGAGEIRRIALEFASTRPSVAFAGDGVTLHANGTQSERAILLLNAVVGNIDQPGGYCLPKVLSLQEPEPFPTQSRVPLEMDDFKAIEPLLQGSSRADLLFVYMANPAYKLPQGPEVRRLLASETHIASLVVMDTHMSETAALADLVLPAATYLESWGLESRPSLEMIPFVGLRQPVVAPVPEAERLKRARDNRFDQPVLRPRGEALSLNELLLHVGRTIGGEMAKALAFRNEEEYVIRRLSQLSGFEEEGGLPRLRKNGVWSPRDQKPSYGSYESGGFPTGTGLMEIFSKGLQERGFSPLPSYEPIERAGEKGLTLVPFRGLPSEGQPNSKWLCEVAHENPAWINEETARGLGVADGDMIEIASGDQRLVVKVRTTQGIHPGVLAISRGAGHSAYGSFARGKPFKGKDPDSHLIWWKRQGNGVQVEPLVSVRQDPISNGPAWMDTVVRVRKV